jgi:hypothetical protein
VAELALLLLDGPVSHYERHPPRRQGSAQRPGHRVIEDNPADQPAAQLGDKPGLALAVQPEPLADHRGKPLPGLEAVPVGGHRASAALPPRADANSRAQRLNAPVRSMRVLSRSTRSIGTGHPNTQQAALQETHVAGGRGI